MTNGARDVWWLVEFVKRRCLIQFVICRWHIQFVMIEFVKWRITHCVWDIWMPPKNGEVHSCWARTVRCVVNMFHKNGMRQLIIGNGTICDSILCWNSPALYLRLRYTYPVISVKLNWLPGNSKKWATDYFVAFGVRFFHSWAIDWVCKMQMTYWVRDM